MGFNRQRKHVLFYGEDEATSNLAQGFVESRKIDDFRCRVFHEFGHGWRSTVEALGKVKMAKYPLTHLVLVIDFDSRGIEHLEKLRDEIRNSPYKDRVYVLGAAKDVGQLQRKLAKETNRYTMSPNAVGCALADRSTPDGECLNGVWGWPELAHNRDELTRLCLAAKDVIFSEEKHDQVS